MDFFKTGMGKRFFSSHIPELVQQFKKLNQNLQSLTDQLNSTDQVWMVIERNPHRAIHIFSSEKRAKDAAEKIQKSIDEYVEGYRPASKYPTIKSFKVDDKERLEDVGSEEWIRGYNY